jgi:cytochrome c oxidase subunit 3
LIGFLAMTMLLGIVFLGIKGYEYHHKYAEQMIPFMEDSSRFAGPEETGLRVFLNLYFIMTGLHAFHMVIGISVLGVLMGMAYRGGLLLERSVAVYNTGLYWHFVDLVWVYLFPFFYLVSGT